MQLTFFSLPRLIVSWVAEVMYPACEVGSTELLHHRGRLTWVRINKGAENGRTAAIVLGE